MQGKLSGRITAPTIEPLAYADGLTAAWYMEPDREDDPQPEAIAQAPVWREGD